MRNPFVGHLSVIKPGLPEDEAKDGDDDDDDEPINPLVDALFDEVEKLRMQVRRLGILPYSPRDRYHFQLYEAEMRCAIIEAETREEVMHEMEDRMQSMEAMHSRRLMSEVHERLSVMAFLLLKIIS